MDKKFSMTPNPLVAFLKKDPKDFTREDIVKFCEANEVEFINFHYCGWDGKIKTLNFVIQSKEHLENILAAGERVDGSSLFPFVEAGKSDLYVVPRYKTAFMNPFAEVPTVDLLCSFFHRDGEPFESSPQYILEKAHEAFKAETGLEMYAMGELEYYVIAPEEKLFLVADQKGYHQSAPFCKFEDLRTEAMRLIAQAGGNIKYGHSEVGNFTQDGKIYEQNEIEFLPVNIEDAADQLAIAKWIMRQLAFAYDADLTFAPTITVGKAGSGMHVHCKFVKDGKSVMTENGELTDICRKAIAGYMDAGTSLPAFGNPHPLSFMRLVPHQEAPTSLCWSFSNRSALVRVPLGWLKPSDMAAKCNPQQPQSDKDFSDKQTFEWRASDGFADTYLLLAALCAAARHGFEMPDALEVAERTYVGLGVNIHDASNKAVQEALEQLPASCVAAAAELEKDRLIYTSKGVFSDNIVDYMISYLRAFNDETMRDDINAGRIDGMKLVMENINNG
ncbi:MAG: glutamine synthetase family protein [Bacteroidales bacterium]|nr:glutamine synthetase family protein [Bacteroidales bacterium]